MMLKKKKNRTSLTKKNVSVKMLIVMVQAISHVQGLRNLIPRLSDTGSRPT
jgi:hypothetical protein